MLAALFGFQVAAGLLLRGAWDLWAQSALLIALICGLSIWAALGVARGRVPSPARRLSVWVALLAALSFSAAYFSPVRVYCLPIWAAGCAGLLLIPGASLLSARDRVRVDQVVRAAAWAMVLLAIHQRFHGQSRPTSFLPNQNVFAGTILLLLPFAARRRDVILSAGLLVCMWWAQSVGAWLGLSISLALHRRAVGPLAFWLGAAAGLAGLVAAYSKLQSPEILHRWVWWTAASRMAFAAPWRGLGPGAFAYAFPAYATSRPELGSLFAHQYFLETAAEMGFPFLLLWIGGLAVLLRRAEPSKRFGPIAALAHGLVDYPLSIPGVFWLFCLSIAWTQPESEEPAIHPGRRILTMVLVLAFAAPCVYWVAGNWAADRIRTSALQNTAALPERTLVLLAASEAIRPHPEAARASAEIDLSMASGSDASRRYESARAHLERAVVLDPYRVTNWILLEDVYRRLSRPEDAMRTHARAAGTRPTLLSAAP